MPHRAPELANPERFPSHTNGVEDRTDLSKGDVWGLGVMFSTLFGTMGDRAHGLAVIRDLSPELAAIIEHGMLVRDPRDDTDGRYAREHPDRPARLSPHELVDVVGLVLFGSNDGFEVESRRVDLAAQVEADEASGRALVPRTLLEAAWLEGMDDDALAAARERLAAVCACA